MNEEYDLSPIKSTIKPIAKSVTKPKRMMIRMDRSNNVKLNSTNCKFVRRMR